jgi:hypothetical protein
MDAVARAPPSLQSSGRRRLVARHGGARGGGSQWIGAPVGGGLEAMAVGRRCH